MIHIAPCSCELHVRIRELEAELEHSNSLRETLWTQRDYQQARADKAEKQVEGLKRIIETAPTPGSLVAENERLKARVAELEARSDEAKAWFAYSPERVPEWVKEKLAREREAD